MGENRSSERPYFLYGNERNYTYVLNVSQHVILTVSNTFIKFTSHVQSSLLETVIKMQYNKAASNVVGMLI